MNKPTFKELYYLCVQKLTNFPYIEEDFDAITNYELLCKVVEELNKMIDNMNTQNQSILALYDAFNTLKTYVDNYFENLDVQEEINNKLDEMTESGELTNLIKDYVDPIYQEYEEEINNNIINMNNKLNFLENKIDSTVSGSPKGVYSTLSDLETADPDHNYIYVVLATGNWYYYNTTNSEWTSGGTYQASVDTNDLETIKYNQNNFGDYLNLSLLNERGGFSGNDLENTDTRNDRFRSPILNLSNPTNIELNDNFVFLVYKKNILTNVTSQEMDNTYVSNYFLIPEENYVYRLLIRNLTNTSMVNDPLDYTILDNVKENIVVTSKSLDGYFYNKLEKGSFGQDIRKIVTQNNRLRTECLYFKTKTKVTIKNNNYTFLYYKMNMETKERSSVQFSNQFIINADNENIYRFLIKKIDNSDITDEELSLIKNNLLYFEKVIEVDVPDTFTTDYKRLIRVNTQSGLLNSNLFEKSFKEFPNGFISIGFDDGFYDVNSAIEYCHANNVPCYYALLPSNADDPNIHTMINNLLSYGGELCSHNVTVITPTIQANEELMFDLFVNTKFILEEKFNTKIHGIIRAGGTGQGTEDLSLDENWCKIAAYEYSDYYGENTPYNLTRNNLTRFTHEQQYQKLLACKNNKEFQIWFCHHVNGQETNSYPNGYTLDDFKYFVDTCLNLDIPIVTPYYVISNYITTDIEKRLEALED